MIPLSPISTRTDTLSPYTTRFRSAVIAVPRTRRARLRPHEARPRKAYGQTRPAYSRRAHKPGKRQGCSIGFPDGSVRNPYHRRRPRPLPKARPPRSEEHTSELQSLMRISYAVFCLKKKKIITHIKHKT